MCYACYEGLGAPVKITEGVLAIVPQIQEADPFGRLHIVVEDWNLDDDAIRHCLDYVPDRSADDEGNFGHGLLSDSERALAEAMLLLDMDERATAMAIVEGFIEPTDG